MGSPQKHIVTRKSTTRGGERRKKRSKTQHVCQRKPVTLNLSNKVASQNIKKEGSKITEGNMAKRKCVKTRHQVYVLYRVLGFVVLHKILSASLLRLNTFACIDARVSLWF